MKFKTNLKKNNEKKAEKILRNCKCGDRLK